MSRHIRPAFASRAESQFFESTPKHALFAIALDLAVTSLGDMDRGKCLAEMERRYHILFRAGVIGGGGPKFPERKPEPRYPLAEFCSGCGALIRPDGDCPNGHGPYFHKERRELPGFPSAASPPPP